MNYNSTLLTEGKPTEQKVLDTYSVDEYYSFLLARKRYNEAQEQAYEAAKRKANDEKRT